MFAYSEWSDDDDVVVGVEYGPAFNLDKKTCDVESNKKTIKQKEKIWISPDPCFMDINFRLIIHAVERSFKKIKPEHDVTNLFPLLEKLSIGAVEVTSTYLNYISEEQEKGNNLSFQLSSFENNAKGFCRIQKKFLSALNILSANSEVKFIQDENYEKLKNFTFDYCQNVNAYIDFIVEEHDESIK